MEITLRKFQDGGAMPPQGAPKDQGAPQEGAPEEGAPQERGQGQDPIMQIAQVAMQALQNKDCEAAMAVCEAFVKMIQQQGQGGAPEQQEAPEGEPVYKSGGKLVRRIRK